MTRLDVATVGRRARQAVADAVGELTAGQRWTVSLMLGLALLVLAFGLPSATRLVLPPRSSAAAETASQSSDGGPAPDAPTLATDPIVRPAHPIDSSDASPTTAPPFDDGTTAPVPSLKVVALVDPAAGTGDRTDEAMAKRFLAAAGVSATVVQLADAAATCEAARVGTLVVSSAPLSAELTSCLHGAGVATLSFDDGFSTGATSLSVSTRRGAARSLLDTATRAHAQLTGKLALVADERLRPALEPALPTARARGLDISTTTWLAPGDSPVGVAVDLAGAGVSGVLFATSVANQSVIGSQLKVLSPGVALGVLDAADSVTTASYPPAFDGALAVTSVQLSWDPGAATQRAACRSVWESAQTPPAILGDAELLRALLWCQHAAMAAAAAERLGAGLVGSLTSQAVDSPVTSRLGGLADGGYGPTRITTATWSAACGCWGASTPFTEGSP